MSIKRNVINSRKQSYFNSPTLTQPLLTRKQFLTNLMNISPKSDESWQLKFQNLVLWLIDICLRLTLNLFFYISKWARAKIASYTSKQCSHWNISLSNQKYDRNTCTFIDFYNHIIFHWSCFPFRSWNSPKSYHYMKIIAFQQLPSLSLYHFVRIIGETSV